MLTWSGAEPRRQADSTPVKTPTTIGATVPTVTIGMVFFRSAISRLVTGCWLANEMPMFPCTRFFR